MLLAGLQSWPPGLNLTAARWWAALKRMKSSLRKKQKKKLKNKKLLFGVSSTKSLLLKEKVSSESIRYPLPFNKTCLASGVA